MERRGLLFAALVVSLGLIVSTWLVSSAVVRVVRIRYQDRTISVTGSARRRIRSDLVVWRARVSGRATELSQAYRTLAAAVPRVTEYIKGKAIPADRIVVSAVHIRELHPRTHDGEEIPEQILGYLLEQVVEVTSNDVDHVGQVSRDITELINQGIVIDSEEPDYLYTRLAELKIRMLAEASRDARVRAQQVASNTRSRISSLRWARMGVIQVNAANDTEVSATGMNDTTTIDKDVLAVVTAAFSTE